MFWDLVLTFSSKANKVNSAINSGYVISKPSNDVIEATDKSISKMKATADENGNGDEYGFVAATDGSTSSIIEGDGAGVSLGPGYEELENQGKEAAFNVHVHREGDNTGSTPISTDEVSGQPGSRSILNDYGYAGLKERQGKASEPNWVIGTKNTQNKNTGTGQVTKGSKKVLIFYNSNKEIKKINWSTFKNNMGKIK